jgi:hypothetical protein
VRDSWTGTVGRGQVSSGAVCSAPDGRGQFFACFHDRTIKTYVQPAWLDAERAQGAAMSDRPLEINLAEMAVAKQAELRRLATPAGRSDVPPASPPGDRRPRGTGLPGAVRSVSVRRIRAADATSLATGCEGGSQLETSH